MGLAWATLFASSLGAQLPQQASFIPAPSGLPQQSRLLPAPPRPPSFADQIAANAFSHLILPSSILGYFSLAYIARMTRSFMIDQLSQEYVTAARIKGNSYWGAVWRHAFPNILVPLITVVGLSYASLLEGAVLTETVFAWPGLGLYLTNSLQNADMNAVLGATIIVGSIFVGLNLLSDLLYQMLDPRTRAMVRR